VAVGFADPSVELVAGAHHGFQVFGEPLEVTRSSGNRVQELDGKPAWERMMERLGMPATTDPIEVAAISILAEELPQEVHEEYGGQFITCSYGAMIESKGHLADHCAQRDVSAEELVVQVAYSVKVE